MMGGAGPLHAPPPPPSALTRPLPCPVLATEQQSAGMEGCTPRGTVEAAASVSWKEGKWVPREGIGGTGLQGRWPTWLPGF